MPGPITYYRPAGLVACAEKFKHARQADKNFYSSTRWLKFRRWYLASHPLCVKCEAKRLTVLAEHVHHVQTRKSHPELAFDEDNCQALCQPCHNAEEVR